MNLPPLNKYEKIALTISITVVTLFLAILAYGWYIN